MGQGFIYCETCTHRAGLLPVMSRGEPESEPSQVWDSWYSFLALLEFPASYQALQFV